MRSSIQALNRGSILPSDERTVMTTEPDVKRPEFPQTYRIRAKSGELAGGWLWTLTVSRNGVPFQALNWDGVLAHPEQYKFAYNFLPTEAGSFLANSRNVAEAFVRILALHGVETEFVPATNTR